MAQEWVTRGFEAFRRGTCGNAGQNLYVSRQGVLQRIFQFDLNQDGYFDLVFCTSQDHEERPPAYVYEDALGERRRRVLPSDGACSGVVADLNGDGYDDLVLGMHYNGIRKELNAFVYYGSATGWGEQATQRLPAPLTTSVAAGDFDGDGRVDLVFLCCPDAAQPARRGVRLFGQSELGFEPRRHADLPIPGHQLTAADLDGDGCADLVLRGEDGGMRVYWGGPGGLDAGRWTDVPLSTADPGGAGKDGGGAAAAPAYPEHVADAELLPAVLCVDGAVRLFAPRPGRAELVPVMPGRRFGQPRLLPCRAPVAAAAADLDGDGHTDVVVACRDRGDGGEGSWICWGPDFRLDACTWLPSRRARDVALGDLDGDGRLEVVLCQGYTETSFTADSVVYRVGVDRRPVEAARLTGEDPRRVFVAHGADDALPQVVFINPFSGGRLGSDRALVYFGGPDGFVAERRGEIPAWGPVESLCCDLDDDGWAEVVVANCAENSVWADPGSFVVDNGPGGLGSRPRWVLPTTRAHGVCCADLDRDGYLDLVFAGFDNPEVLVFHGTADGFGTEHPERIRLEQEGVVYREPRWIYLADLDNDGWLDLVVPDIAADRSLLLWGGPGGFSMDRCRMLSVWHASCVRAADLTGNGYLDLIVGGHEPSLRGLHDSFVYIYWNGPEGLREDRRTLLPAKAVNALCVADFNGDGLLDLFACSYHDGLERDVDSYLYWQRPGRGFSEADRTRFFTHSASGCVAADFDEDGHIDLAVAYHKTEGAHVGRSAVWWNGPEGFDPRRVTLLPTEGPHGMTAVSAGNQRDRGPEEHYESPPCELTRTAAVARIQWWGGVPPKTWVRAQLRFAATPEALDQAAWSGPGGAGAWCQAGEAVRVPAGSRWAQYRLALGATNGLRTPRLDEVRVRFEA
ncbi:MAG: VCBS repeat-containing protein [Candidatus Latescibacterota bacterium]